MSVYIRNCCAFTLCYEALPFKIFGFNLIIHVNVLWPECISVIVASCFLVITGRQLLFRVRRPSRAASKSSGCTERMRRSLRSEPWISSSTGPQRKEVRGRVASRNSELKASAVLTRGRYVFYRADNDYYRASSPITNILSQFIYLV